MFSALMPLWVEKSPPVVFQYLIFLVIIWQDIWWNLLVTSHQLSTLDYQASCMIYWIALKFGMCLGSSVAKRYVKFQNDWRNQNTNLRQGFITSRDLIRCLIFFNDTEMSPSTQVVWTERTVMWRSYVILSVSSNNELIKQHIDQWNYNCVLYQWFGARLQ